MMTCTKRSRPDSFAHSMPAQAYNWLCIYQIRNSRQFGTMFQLQNIMLRIFKWPTSGTGLGDRKNKQLAEDHVSGPTLPSCHEMTPPPPPPLAAAAPPARGRRLHPVRSPPTPRRVRGRQHGRRGCCSCGAVCCNRTTDPLPYIRTTAIGRFAKLFLLPANPLVVPRTRIRRLVLHPVECRGFVGLTLHGFVGLVASPFGGKWRGFGNLGNVCS